MDRLKKNNVSKADAIKEASKIFGKIKGKQIIGFTKFSPYGKPTINKYHLEDGDIVFEDIKNKRIYPKDLNFVPIKNFKEIEK